MMETQIIFAGDNTERTETSDGGVARLCDADRNPEPYDGMLFDTEEAARAYYDEYARRKGFTTRVLSSRKSERDGSIISRGLGCKGVPPNNQKPQNVDGKKRDRRRNGCTATFLVKREKPGRWVVRKFVRDHDHPLIGSLPKSRPTFDEKDKRIQELNAELRLKKRLCAAYHEQLLGIIKDVENHNEHLCTNVEVVQNNLKELEDKSGNV